MAVNPLYEAFNPDIATHLEEAFERAGIAPDAIGQRHIESAIRSMGFMLNSEWHTLGMRQWMIERTQYTTTINLPYFLLPLGGIDIFDAVLIRMNAATPINRMSRAEYLEIPNKSQTGRPDRYFTDRQASGVTVNLWRTPENNTDVIDYYFFKQMPTSGEISYTLDMPPHVLEAFVSGLAAKLSQKFAYDRFKDLQTLYRGPDVNKIGGALKFAVEEDRDRADLSTTIQLNPRGGRRAY